MLNCDFFRNLQVLYGNCNEKIDMKFTIKIINTKFSNIKIIGIIFAIKMLLIFRHFYLN